MFFAVILLLGTVTFEFTSTEGKISHNHEKAVQALYLAEAGIQIAIDQLEANPTWEGSYKNLDFEPGTIKTITVNNKNTSPQIRIEAQGEVDGISRRIRVDLKKEKFLFKNAMTVNSLQLKPFTNLNVKGDLFVTGDLILPPFSCLEGFLTVGGKVILNDAVFSGSLAATESIILSENTIIEGFLLSTKEIICNGNWNEVENCFSHYQGIKAVESPEIDFEWYQNNKQEVLTETSFNVNELDSGIYISPDDLILSAKATETYYGKKAIVSEGAITIANNLIPQDPHEDILLIIAENIFVESQVDNLWAGLIAKDSIVIQEGNRSKNLFGAVQAGLVDLPPGVTNLQFYPLPGENLAESPQFLFKLVDWLEIAVL